MYKGYKLKLQNSAGPFGACHELLITMHIKLVRNDPPECQNKTNIHIVQITTCTASMGEG